MLMGVCEWMRRRLRDGIVVYRRHVSGRGPLRAVRCSFGATESCSTYGLRVATTPGRTLRDSIAKIRARLRRCHDCSVYVARDGALRWGADFDDLERVDDRAQRAEELPRTRGALLRAAIALARRRGRPVVQRLRVQLRRLRLPPDARERLPLRSADAHLRARAIATTLRVALGVVIALVVASMSWVLAAAVAMALSIRAVAARRSTGRRFAAQARLDAFEVPHAPLWRTPPG